MSHSQKSVRAEPASPFSLARCRCPGQELQPGLEGEAAAQTWRKPLFGFPDAASFQPPHPSGPLSKIWCFSQWYPVSHAGLLSASLGLPGLSSNVTSGTLPALLNPSSSVNPQHRGHLLMSCRVSSSARQGNAKAAGAVVHSSACPQTLCVSPNLTTPGT